ncbi:MAG TPA: hypothetical protein VK327_09715 [Candidatus Paceibacterota bacterium]|nr:hypothetical protein [Candidatus Paceibacterota bacterium]
MAATKAKASQATANNTTLDFAASTQLTKAMEKIPAVRADKIAMAKALVENPNYPDKATLQQVANIITDHLKPENPA